MGLLAALGCDGGTAPDAGAADAAADAGPGADAGLDAGFDAGFDAGPAALHACVTFEDRTDAAADRTIDFGGLFDAYRPACMRIAAGQTVTFAGSFERHNLEGGVTPTRPADPPGSSGNPIPSLNVGVDTTLDVTFPAAGTFPYFCLQHQSLGMFGVVLVE